MAATDRLQAEQAFHDRQARHRALTFARHPQDLAFTDDAYLDHETWIRPAFARMGDVSGEAILDFGCGHAMAAVVLARRGATVTAFDISAGYLAEGRRRAALNDVTIRFLQANGETLPFADRSFCGIWGNAILHHLDLDRAGREIRRVLIPNGRAVFCEPWSGNRVLRWARQHIPYAGKDRTPDEEPLGKRQLRILRRHFSEVTVEGYQLLGLARRVFARSKLVDGLDWCDAMLLGRIGGLERWCRYVVITLRP
jgi:SAM-dependent methyltransferase